MMQRSVVMEGSLDEFDLVSVVQTVSIGRQATGVELRDDRGAVVGTLLLKAGQIVSANAEGLSGLDAVRRLLKTAKSRRFYVYRAPGVEFMDRVGPVSQVLAQLMAQPVTPDSPPILMQGSLGEHDMRTIAEAVSLGRQAVGIEVFAPDGRRVGALYLKGGMILFAAWGRSAGEPALHELFKPRKDGRFVVFRSPEARIGEPLARLRDVLQPRIATTSSRVSAPPSSGRAPEGTLRPSAHAPETARRTRPPLSADSVIVDLDDQGESEGEDTQVTRVAAPPSAEVPSAAAPSRPPPSAAPAARRTVPPPPASTVRTSVPPPVAQRPTQRPAAAAPAAPQPASARPVPTVVNAPVSPSVVTVPPPAMVATPDPTPVSAPDAPAADTTARRSFRPPSPEPSHPQSEAPAAPRFRHSDASARGSSPLLLEEPAEPIVGGPGAAQRTPIVCINSPRGGVGRTTVTLNLAVSLARRGRRVTVVDADANGLLPALHSTGRSYFGVADVLEGRAALGEAVLSTRIEGLKLLPSGELSDDTYRHPGWAPLLATLADQTDVVLIDCAPIWYGATLTALACATHQLTVVAAEPAAQRACSSYQARLPQLVKSPPRALGIVLNMLDYQASASLKALEELCSGEHARLVFDTTIPRSPAFLEASARGLPIVHADRGASPTIAWVFETLATAVLERLELEVPSFASPLLS